MARPLRISYPGAFYHITSRGNEQKIVFKSIPDRERFLEYLESAVTVRIDIVRNAELAVVQKRGNFEAFPN